MVGEFLLIDFLLPINQQLKGIINVNELIIILTKCHAYTDIIHLKLSK